jgi:peptidoglycan/xylan/chitin deacetylase (PgdA/CDA1 family)
MRSVSVAAMALVGIVWCGSAIAAAPYESPIPILVYHHIRVTKPYPKATWSYKMSVSPTVFEKQMQWLKDKGYTTITLDEYVALRSGAKKAVAKPVVITFDDNNRSQYELAYPVLARNGQTAVFYLITNRLKNPGFLTEDEIRAMSAGGMDIQSHSVTHAIMTNLAAKRLEQELADSKKTLQALVSTPVRHLAYPLTAHNQRIRAAAAAAGYVTATIMDPRNAKMSDDAMKLPRIMMTDDTVLSKVLP